jgi:hypothetical protein
MAYYHIMTYKSRCKNKVCPYRITFDSDWRVFFPQTLR